MRTKCCEKCWHINLAHETSQNYCENPDCECHNILSQHQSSKWEERFENNIPKHDGLTYEFGYKYQQEAYGITQINTVTDWENIKKFCSTVEQEARASVITEIETAIDNLQMGSESDKIRYLKKHLTKLHNNDK